MVLGLLGIGGKRSKPLILHVEDDKDIRIIIKDVLEDMGYDVLSAENGPEGLKMAVSGMPDLVVLDVTMPGMDGFDVCWRIKKDPKTSHMPVLMMTALGQMKDVEKAMSNGADDYAVKPLDFNKFQMKVRRLLKQDAPPQPT